MDIVDYHIFINLLVNHIKIVSVKCRKFVLIFDLHRTAILFRLFFPCYRKAKKKKKQKQKIITKPINKNRNILYKSYLRFESKKINYANNKNQNMKREKEKKNT